MLWQISSKPLLFFSALPGTVYELDVRSLLRIAIQGMRTKYLCVAQALEEMRSAYESNIVIPHDHPLDVRARLLESILEDWRISAMLFGNRLIIRDIP